MDAEPIYELLTEAAGLLPSADGLEAFQAALSESDLKSAHAELLDAAQKHPLPLLFWTKVSQAADLLGVP